MSEAELAAMVKVGSAVDTRWDELKKAVEGAVQEGRILMQNQERRSVEEFNDDSEYSKMLQEAVKVRALSCTALWLRQGGRDKVAKSKTDPCRCLWLRDEVLVLARMVEAGAYSMRSFTCV